MTSHQKRNEEIAKEREARPFRVSLLPSAPDGCGGQHVS